MNIDNILLRYNYISVPANGSDKVSKEALATIMMNLAYYGKALSVEAFKALKQASSSSVADWWMTIERELKLISGESRKIGDFVVYKNFPKECLDKSQAEYWSAQLLMYWGFPNEFFTQDEKPRAKMTEKTKPTVLKLAKAETSKEIFNELLKSPARWKQEELFDVTYLSDMHDVDFTKIAFKENLVHMAATFLLKNKQVKIKSATDVLRLAAGLSDGDVSLRKPGKLKSFSKPMRRFLLSALESASNLEEDVARKGELFKRLFHQLHPGDYSSRFPKTVKVANDLYRDNLTTWNSKLEKALSEKNEEALVLLKDRPGEFRRRLVHTMGLFGSKAVKAFTKKDVLDKLSTAQVVSLRSFLETVNIRTTRTFPPKGNWARMQIGEVRPIHEKQGATVVKALGKVLSKRVPKVGTLDPATSMIKLPSNDGEVSPYARGTEFDIPKDVEFIRTASYWKAKAEGYYNIWFDNGWNFFADEWKTVGTCSWSSNVFPSRGYGYWLDQRKPTKDTAAVFSGDPTNSKEMEGRACQMIDLYPKKLKAHGVRYCVWSILCYSGIPFSKAEDVFAALQWGEDAQSGKLFEPSRCQIAFPLKGDSLTKFICVLDLYTNKLIYIDANFNGSVRSADNNNEKLSKMMPSYLEYLSALPSVHDLFRESVDEKSETQVLYSDKDADLQGETAYVFKPENKKSKYKSLSINNILT